MCAALSLGRVVSVQPLEKENPDTRIVYDIVKQDSELLVFCQGQVNTHLII